MALQTGIKYTIGPVVVLDTNPSRREQRHRDTVPGNQATCLFFPVFGALILVLVSALSVPIMGGLSIVDVNMGNNGTVQFGSWGWCAENVPDLTDKCSPLRAYASSMNHTLSTLPGPVDSLKDLAGALPTPYLGARDTFEVLGVVSAWLTAFATLAAAGFWQNQNPVAWGWTRWSYVGSYTSALFSIVSWGLSLGQVTRYKAQAVRVDGTKASVSCGPVIWMMMVAISLNLAVIGIRIWGHRQPRPFWTIKGQEIGAVQADSTAQPSSASSANLDDGDKPPAWESLNLDEMSTNGPKRSSIDKAEYVA